MAASTMTTAPFNFTLDVPILVAADLDGATVTLRTDTDAITRDVAAALRRLADEIEPTTDQGEAARVARDWRMGAQTEALNAARHGRRVVIALDEIEQSERLLAEIADHVAPESAWYTRVNGQHRLGFPKGGSIRAVIADTRVGSRSPEVLVVSQERIEQYVSGHILAGLRTALGLDTDPDIIIA